MLRKLSHFEKVKAEDFNKLVDLVNRLSDMSAAPPLELRRATGRIQIRLSESGFLAAVTARFDRLASSSSSDGSATLSSSSSAGPCAYAGNRYSYTLEEVVSSECGTWEFADAGRIVTAWEWNDNDVDVGTVVLVEPYDNNDWRFNYGSSPEDSSSDVSGFCADAPPCVPFVAAATCDENNGLQTLTKYLSIVNGQLCVSDDNCITPSSSSVPCVWDGAGYYCVSGSCEFISDCEVWADAGRPGGPYDSSSECDGSCGGE